MIIITGISCLTNAVNNTETRSNKIAGTSAVKKVNQCQIINM